MTNYDPNAVDLTALISSVERLKKYLAIKYGVSMQDLYLREPTLKPVIEFFMLELDALNAKVYDLETKVNDMNNPPDDEGYPPYGVMF